MAQVGINISVNLAPPELPVYEQPAIPAEGYLWTPGYWAWSGDYQGYYWVPGTWVLVPQPGFLWTHRPRGVRGPPATARRGARQRVRPALLRRSLRTYRLPRRAGDRQGNQRHEIERASCRERVQTPYLPASQ